MAMENFLSLFQGLGGLREPYFLFVLMGIVLAGAFVTSGFGIGGGVMMTPLFILFLPAKFAIGLLAPLMLLISGTGVRQYWGQWSAHSILVLLPSSLVGIWVGTYLLAEIPAAFVTKTVGVLAIGFGISQFSLHRPSGLERPAPAGDLAGGGIRFCLGHHHRARPQRGDHLLFLSAAAQPNKGDIRKHRVFLFFTAGIVKVGTYAYYGILTFPIFLVSLTLVPALIFGSIAGKRLNRLIPNKLFLRLICVLVVAMGIKLTFW